MGIALIISSNSQWENKLSISQTICVDLSKWRFKKEVVESTGRVFDILIAHCRASCKQLCSKKEKCYLKYLVSFTRYKNRKRCYSYHFCPQGLPESTKMFLMAPLRGHIDNIFMQTNIFFK